MTEKLNCPFCGSELQTDNEIARLIMWRCHTPGCLLNGWHSIEIIQHLIDGKKAQRQLRTVKDRCVKKVKAKEREIANYLNGINVRNKEIQNLCEQLQKAQGALEDIIYFFDVVCQKDEMYFYDLIDNNIKKYREIAFITKQEE